MNEQHIENIQLENFLQLQKKRIKKEKMFKNNNSIFQIH